jgi:rSAM/selenodomain-associated transferase 1
MNIVVVFSKKPQQGKTKTRLAPPLTLNEAEELSEAFLKDTIKLIDDINCINQRVIYFYPPLAFEYFKSITGGTDNSLKNNILSPSSWMVKNQEGKNLGERLLNAIIDELRDHSRNPGSDGKEGKLLIIGSDSPTIPEEYIKEALLVLESEDIVLGPAEDGGFYLIGAKKGWPGIFKSVRWSSRDTLKDVIINIKKSDIKYKLLQRWYDVDEISDVRKLSKDLNKMPDFYCSNTRSILNKLDKKLKLL